MTLKSELAIRAKTLYRRAWLAKNAVTEADEDVYFANVVIANGVRILKIAGTWTVIVRENNHEFVVYYENGHDGASVDKGRLRKTVEKLQSAMILDDLASI